MIVIWLLLLVVSRCMLHFVKFNYEEASRVPGRSVASAGFTSSNLRF
jgi:hypothetical protein